MNASPYGSAIVRCVASVIFGRGEAGLSEDQIGLLHRARRVVGERFGKSEDPAVAGIGDVQVSVRVHRKADRKEETGRVGRIGVVAWIVDQRLLKVGLTDDQIRFRARLNVAQVVVAQDAIVIGIRDVEMRRARGQIDGDSGVRRSGVRVLEIEFAPLDQVGGVEVHGILPEHAGLQGRMRCRFEE